MRARPGTRGSRDARTARPVTTSPLAPVDAVVIGGGPGGSSAATMMARKGLRVVLLERDHFPRDHVGESLLPASVPMLESMGVLPAVEAAGFVRKRGATMVWGSDMEPWSWYFNEVSERYPTSFQVVRSEFDRILLDHARASGVDVREGHQVTEVPFLDGRATGAAYRTEDGGEGFVQASWVVDASGQTALLGRALGLREWDDFFRNLAIYGYFEGASRLPEPADTNIFIESYEHGWCWAIPLHTGVSSVGAVVDSEEGQRAIREDGVEAAFQAQLDLAPRTSELIEGTKLVDGPYVVRDWSYLSTRMVGPGYILVGDAACFIDPLFSSGVHLALTSGLAAAAYVGSVLQDPTLEGPAAEAYRSLYLGQYESFHRLAQLFYSSNRSAESYFWEARRISEEDAFTPRHAFVRMVAGQPPIGYERAVLDRGDAPSTFVSSVRAVEEERARRRAQLQATSPLAIAAFAPVLDPDERVERKPTLERDSFEWGFVLTSEGRPEGAPISVPVARLLRGADGQATIGQIVDQMAVEARLNPGQRQQLLEQMVVAVGILYVDGAVEELRGLDDTS
ncbi:MAG: NAD(P)/FAD-dependent oxidoreductase [Chloroflexi bacterium]|nr:NAD(P)/FAD-dependent oxidoreductase [Chloroflexota bacterium]